MKRARHQLLAHAALSPDDDVGGRPCHPLYGIEDVAHRIGRTDQIAMGTLAAYLLAENSVLALNV